MISESQENHVLDHQAHEKPPLQKQVRKALDKVKDPEIPTVSIVELGMLHDIHIDRRRVIVRAIPTFAGCPALDIIKQNIIEAVLQVDSIAEVHVEYVYDVTWTTGRVSEKAREKMKAYGIAPPPERHSEGEPWQVDCPYCGSTYTTLENIFGPAACKSMLYCSSCKNPFEAMKPV